MESDLLLEAFSPELTLDYSSAAFLFADLMPELEARRTAFVSYLRPVGAQTMVERSVSGRNVHRRLIEMLRSIPRAEERMTAAASRGFRHMMRERQRREKLSQCYANLHSMLASGSKVLSYHIHVFIDGMLLIDCFSVVQFDKNSIVKSATKRLQELKGVKEALQKRYEELKAEVLGSDPTEGEKVNIRAANLSSPVDSMIGVLRCLQSMDATAKAIRARLSSSELSAVMRIDTEVCRNMAAADVERAIEGAAMEAEKRLGCQITGINMVTTT
ncbi:hypothetical protein B296_00043357 [Ensete ventricosum]|uniref:BHLH domain-containing protein n=1 Tax=Ensete ventricosum TaxID=4639 RepID=A0A426ZEV2_ENSVE|nr:hypothetical protein B296_00043357 [Ensete ventricosum]